MKLGWSRLTLNAPQAVAIVCLLGVAGSNGQTAPGAQMAEQVFKSVVVLKGISVDEFMDTMGFFSASLSWNCTDCHGDDAVDSWANFAKDTERKTMARKMILMVRMINQSQFGGKRMVTCYTCHRGDPSPKITPNLAEQYSNSDNQDADDIELANRPATSRDALCRSNSEQVYSGTWWRAATCCPHQPRSQRHLLRLRHG